MGACFFALSLGGCGAGASLPAAAPEGSRAPQGAIVSLFPAGADWVVRLRPTAIFADPTLGPIGRTLLPRSLVDRVANKTGVELDALEEAVVAGYAGGVLMILQGPWAARDVVRANAPLMNPLETESRDPYERAGGWLGTRRVDLIALNDHRLLVAEGAPQALIALLQKEAPEPAMEQKWGAFRALERAQRDALAALFVPEPLDLPLPPEQPAEPDAESLPHGLPTSRGLALLLARQQQLAVAVHTAGQAEAGLENEDGAGQEADLLLQITLTGEFPSTAVENFTQLVRSVAQTELGRAIGIESGARGLSVQAGGGQVELQVGLRSELLVGVLRTLLANSMEEALEGL